jgi:hypothetical protein
VDPIVVEDERTVYSYNNGEALVTTRRLVLGNESWPLDQIAQVELVTHNDWFADYLSRGSQRGVNAMWRGMARAFGGMLVFAIAIFLEPLEEELSLAWVLLFGVPGAVGLALFVTGVFTAFRAYLKHPPQVYGVRVVLKDAPVAGEASVARYRFNYKPPADRTIQAAQTTLKSQDLIRASTLDEQHGKEIDLKR